MLPLGHPILLRGIWTSSPMKYAMSQTKILNRLLSELKCIVGAEDFDHRLILGNNLKEEVLNARKYLLATLQDICPTRPGVVINEHHVVLASCWRGMRGRTPNIAVNQVKRAMGRWTSAGWVRRSMVFPEFTRLTMKLR